MGTTGRQREKRTLRLGSRERIQMLRIETFSSVSIEFKQTSSKMSEVSQDMDMLLLTQLQIARMTALTRMDGAIYCKAATHIPQVAD